MISASCVCIGSFLRLYFIGQERPFLYRAKIWGIGKLWEVSHLVLSKNRIVDPKIQCQWKCIYFLPPSSFKSLEEDIFCQLPCIIFFSDCNLSTPPSLHDDMMTIIIKLMKKQVIIIILIMDTFVLIMIVVSQARGRVWRQIGGNKTFWWPLHPTDGQENSSL